MLAQGLLLMRIDVNVTKDDFRALCRSIVKPDRSGSNRVRGLLLLVVFSVVLVSVLTVVLAFTGFSLDLDVKTSVITILLYVGVQCVLQRGAQKRVSPAVSGTVLGWHSYEIGDDGISESSEHTECLIRWSGVLELRETGAHFFIMIDRNAGCIIPKRALANSEAEQALRSMVTSRIHSSG